MASLFLVQWSPMKPLLCLLAGTLAAGLSGTPRLFAGLPGRPREPGLAGQASPARRTGKPAQFLAFRGGGNMTLQVSSKSFPAGGEIPRKFTCDGQDVSPQLAWNSLPAGTSAVAVLLEDPDAPGGTFTHWVLYDLPPGMSSLAEGVPATGEIPGGGLQGLNDFGKIGYGGPCPPPGRPHRYIFKVHALDKALGLKAGATKSSVQQAMRGHVLAQGETMGRYRR